jgi:metal-sulfur cluster biosynthetic enzyme
MLTNEKVITTLKTIKDPEVNLDIWTMGLIYNIDIQENTVKILMTYTTPFCPWGPDLQEQIKSALEDAGAKKIIIEVTFDPPYKMPDELRLMLGI